MNPRILAFVVVSIVASSANAQLILYPNDTPLTVPDGGAGDATSWLTTNVSATTTGVRVYVEVTFSDPANSGSMLYLLGPNLVPPSGFCYLGCAAGGDVFMIIDDAAPENCATLGCCQSGCGSPGNPVWCHSYDSLVDFFGGEPSSGYPWGFRAGDGPPTAGTVIEDWILYLDLEGGVFFDGFESGDALLWGSRRSTEPRSVLTAW